MAVMAPTAPRPVVYEGTSGSTLERLFALKENATSLATEIRAGLTTFFVMAYIIFVNPAILSFAGVKDLEGKGPPFAAVVAATCLVAGIMTLAMGLYARYPLAIAPGMGLNAVVAFQLVAGMGLSWQAAMGVIFMEGLIITALVLLGFREAVANAIPLSLKRAIGVGIGLFIMFIGLYEGGFVRVPIPTSTPLTLGNFTSLPFVMTLLGLVLAVVLIARRVKGALLISILAVTLIATVVRGVFGADVSSVSSAAMWPSRWGGPDFATLGSGLNLDMFAKLGFLSAVLAIFSIMLSDFFDTIGTVMGIGSEAGWLDNEGKLPRLKRVLTVDSLAALVGGLFGTSSATTYIESAAGVSEGGRTGLTSVVTGILFLLCIFLAPLAGMVPPEATAPALILVGFYMSSAARGIDFSDLEIGLPALLTVVVMPLTYSITNGIGMGFVSYCLIKLVRGKASEVHLMLWLVSLAFLLYFALPALHLAFGI